jgi:prepilin-type N-terminal cleavage/methylation domain-containing protein
MYRLGFSLVELLIVVAIIAILSTAAIPSYNKYATKARVFELLNIAQTFKIQLIENMYAGHSDTQEIVLENPMVERVKMQTIAGNPDVHVIEVIAKMQTADQNGIGIAAQGQPLILQLQGTASGEILSWTCHVAPQYNNYVPAQCQNNELM